MIISSTKSFKTAIATVWISYCAQLALATGLDFVLSVAHYDVGTSSTVSQFSSLGGLIRQIPINGLASFLAVDSQGNLYVTVQEAGFFGQRVDKYDYQGQFQSTLTTQSGGPPSLAGLGVDSADRLYVGLNAVTDSVIRFSPQGESLGLFATVSSGPPGAPFALQFDSQDRLYVPDQFVTERFDTNGVSLGTIGAIPNNSQGFINDLTIDREDNLYVHTLDNKIHVFGPNGSQIDLLTPSIKSRRIDVDRNGNLFVGGITDEHSVIVQRLKNDGTPLDIFASGLGFDISDLVVFDPIPEPSTLWLGLIAFLGTLIRLR